MRIIGIDPGYAIVGYGVLDYAGNKFGVVDYGAVTTPAGMPFTQRLDRIYDELEVLLKQYRPEYMALEKLFFTTNQKTAIDVAQARGVIQLCAVKYGVGVAEYTPLQVKSSVVGYGKAEKKQVQAMTKTLLNLDSVPKPDDTADALAIAICHAHSAYSGMGMAKLIAQAQAQSKW
ncbi:crossover junction endodeoxyribonuclease RuvC [Ruminococcaceae bacterium OttesenSCG-928-L11]|nr:crossover junction endodeoxyribonuclease RuvC [Ruminococcaceae bacterium OttesenSCG-928-L11]